MARDHVNLLRPINSDGKIKKGKRQSACLLTDRNGVTFDHMLPVTPAEAGLPWRPGYERVLRGQDQIPPSPQAPPRKQSRSYHAGPAPFVQITLRRPWALTPKGLCDFEVLLIEQSLGSVSKIPYQKRRMEDHICAAGGTRAPSLSFQPRRGRTQKEF